jgi:ribosomal subunit interface protein
MMDITFTGRHTTVPERFRRHASAKLLKLEKLDHNAIRIDVEVSTERNPRQSDRSERVELTIRSRGPAIRAEAAADDRYAALDLAFAKLEGQLRKASERRKTRHGDLTVRSAEAMSAVGAATQATAAMAVAMVDPQSLDVPAPDDHAMLNGTRVGRKLNGQGRFRTENVVPLPTLREADIDAGPDFASFRDGAEAEAAVSGVLPIEMEGDGPLVVREKFHASQPMTIDQALFEMELVGHDFYAFHDSGCNKFSVVYRRTGYDYGVIRLVED